MRERGKPVAIGTDDNGEYVCGECGWVTDCEHVQDFAAKRTASLSKDFGASDGVEALLDQRGKTHGHYPDQARTADDLRRDMMCTRNWDDMTPAARDALLMIAVKISRICNGSYDTVDHWEDIAGYATLAADTFRK